MAAVLLGWAGAAASQPRPVVVELYTSEGCSSCPPAEAYIGELAKRRDVLALSFHVDYWDGLGWPDRFALAEAVVRQRNYARAFARSSVYTPEAVIDGRRDVVGSDRRAMAAALAEARDDGVPIGLSAGDGTVTISIGQQSGVAASEIILVVYQRKAVAKVARGENAGRMIEEFNIVRSFRALGRWSGEARAFRERIDSMPEGATDVAVLVQPLGLAPIVGAATLPLVAPERTTSID
jgi:hypothetical protein